jgi:hypothetical protein
MPLEARHGTKRSKLLTETIYGYVQQPRSLYGVVSLELTSFSQSLGRFTPMASENDPDVVKGQKIALETVVVPATLSVTSVGMCACAYDQFVKQHPELER